MLSVIDVASINFICGWSLGIVMAAFLLVWAAVRDRTRNIAYYREKLFDMFEWDEVIFKDFSPHLREGEIILPEVI